MEIRKPLLFNFLLASIVAALVLIMSRGEFLRRVDLLASDTLFILRGKLKVEPPIVIVEITDEDVAKIGRWPWKRSWHAAMTKVLSDIGANSIYFDAIFSEPSSDEAEDTLFAEALRISKRAYLPYVFPERPFNINNALLPLKKFAQHLRGMGAMNVYPDKDGVIRRIPILFKGESGTYPHISLRMAMDYMGYEIKEAAPGSLVLKRDNEELKVPLSDRNEAIINWIGKWTDSFRHYSYVDVLASYQDKLEKKTPVLDLAVFKNKIVLIGITGFGLYDIKPIPLEPEYPGIGIVANVINMLLEKKFIKPVPERINYILICVMALIPALVISGKNPFRETVVTALVAAIFFLGSFFFFLNGNLVPPFFPIFALFTGYVTVGTYSFIRTTIEKQSLFTIAITDGLTGLNNIRYFKLMLENEIRMVRTGLSQGFSVALSDIDHFKDFNDKYGHQVGDLVLRGVAQALRNAVRTSDVAARYGGEEMIMLLKNVPLRAGLEISEKIRVAVESKKIEDGDKKYSVKITLGVASYKHEEDTVESIIKRADEALYLGKESGRNCVRTIEDI